MKSLLALLLVSCAVDAVGVCKKSCEWNLGCTGADAETITACQALCERDAPDPFHIAFCANSAAIVASLDACLDHKVCHEYQDCRAALPHCVPKPH